MLMYNSGGGLGDSIQLFDTITSLKKKFGEKNVYYLSSHENHYGSASKKWFGEVLDDAKSNGKSVDQVLQEQMVNQKKKSKSYGKLKGVCCFTFEKLNETMSRKQIADKYNVGTSTVENVFERKINPIKKALA